MRRGGRGGSAGAHVLSQASLPLDHGRTGPRRRLAGRVSPRAFAPRHHPSPFALCSSPPRGCSPPRLLADVVTCDGYPNASPSALLPTSTVLLSTLFPT